MTNDQQIQNLLQVLRIETGRDQTAFRWLGATGGFELRLLPAIISWWERETDRRQSLLEFLCEQGVLTQDAKETVDAIEDGFLPLAKVSDFVTPDGKEHLQAALEQALTRGNRPAQRAKSAPGANWQETAQGEFLPLVQAAPPRSLRPLQATPGPEKSGVPDGPFIQFDETDSEPDTKSKPESDACKKREPGECISFDQPDSPAGSEKTPGPEDHA